MHARSSVSSYRFQNPVQCLLSCQLTSLAVCFSQATILHEIMHALGFWHEHSRPDRAKHIEIYWENIDTGTYVTC